MSGLLDPLWALLWPRRCCGCDALLPPVMSAQAFCAPCAQTLERPDRRCACARCDAPLAAPGLRCGDCQRVQPAFERLRAAFCYGGAVGEALRRLKWQGRDDLAGPLGGLLAVELRAAAPADLLVPVPLHPRRLRQRGYNQVLLLAQAARRAAGERGRELRLCPEVLLRRRDDAPQRHADPVQRAAAAAGAFAVAPGAAARLRGRRVLLVDDVATTLATAHACAAALRAAEAGAVEVLTLARAAS